MKFLITQTLWMAAVMLVTLLFIYEINGIPTTATTTIISTNNQEQQSKIDDHLIEDDSDMLMEPDELKESTSVYASEFYPTTNTFRPIVQTSPADYVNVERSLGGHVHSEIISSLTSPSQQQQQQQQQHQQQQLSSPELPIDAQTQEAQNFFPAFFRDVVPPLGHSRPYYTHEQQQRHPYGRGGGGNGGNGYDDSILGSGNFGVIRGGTFYQDSDPPVRGLPTNDFYGFFNNNNNNNNNNGHGRPHAIPYTQKLTYNDKQFANFRDFADINTPNDPAYSQFIVVYANKNATTPSASAVTAPSSSSSPTSHSNPKNIFEQLQLLDKENDKHSIDDDNVNGDQINNDDFDYDNENDDDDDHPYNNGNVLTKPEKKNKKISKIKLKLQSTKIAKSYKKKLNPKDGDYEPLLALS